MSIHARQRKDGKTVYDVRLRPPDGGKEYSKTFRTRKEAERYQAAELVDKARGAWIDPRKGRVTLADYCAGWLAQRHDLRSSTRELYDGLLRRKIIPVLGDVELAAISPSTVRAWHAELMATGKVSTAAKAYRLLRTILGTAATDEIIVKNPCAIRGAAVERTPERPVATVAQVEALATAVGDRYRCLVLVATYCGLRLGEVMALRRRHVDLLHGRVRVEESARDVIGGGRCYGPPKTAAGRRTVAVPPHIVPAVEAHLATYVGADPDALVFTGETGAPLPRAKWNVRWRKATAAVGMTGFHFHDLRHTGNTLAAATGASTKELMARMGHASPRAALIYQHATQERDDGVAAAISKLVAAPPEAPVLLRTPGVR